ncbi:MAG: hypothetical protein K2Y21_04195 [Phycisphaerales bacterium]|nr:hypothetical protein [Phycisphaerales bacterium]
MVRFGIIFGLLFQSFVAICCGQWTSPRATDGCCGPRESECCCCPHEESTTNDACCGESDEGACCATEPTKERSGCDCCVVTQDVPQAPVTPDRRPTTDTAGVTIPAPPMALVHVGGWREPNRLALRHEPPWRAGRAVLAGQCRWNL